MPATRDAATVQSFGDEWERFDQRQVSENTLRDIWANYFEIFPWPLLPPEPTGIDIGCGSGRWANLTSEKVARLHCVDPSPKALAVAAQALASRENVTVALAAAGELPYSDASFDFGYSLGVLHHTPDPYRALQDCVRVLRPGAPFLVYLYYALDNRPLWFRLIWRVTDRARRRISRMPFGRRYFVSLLIAVLVYVPLATIARFGARLGRDVDGWPLASYRDKPFYIVTIQAP
jgi:SAM-dependent methyltransferase